MPETLSRRSLMLAGGTTVFTAVAASVPVKAAVPHFSPEYYETYRAWVDFQRTKEIQRRFDVSEAEAILERSAIERWREAKTALLARPVECLMDVLALLRISAWQNGHFVSTQDWAVDSDEIKTLFAVEALTAAVPWSVPDDLRVLDEKRRIEEELRPRIERINISGEDYLADWNDV